MALIIDRRVGQSDKSNINRKKFLDRSKYRIQEAIKKSVGEKNIKDIGSKEKVKVRQKDIVEPSFHRTHSSGNNKRVLPGNKEFDEGDLSPKPEEGEGSGGYDGEGLDNFEFTLTKEEFLEYLFEDLELPDFVKESIKVTDSSKWQKSGFTNSGSPANLSVIRTFKKSIGRRFALERPTDEDVADAHRRWMQALEAEIPTKELEELYEEWKDLERKQKRVPFIDDTDLRYTYYDKKPSPNSQAVMFCLMDVSGSMGEKEKDIAKRFFLLLYLFLERKYDKVDIRFIRHTTEADDVDEQTFFYDTKSGGTRISSGLQLISDLIKKEYNPTDFNIYISQVTDGDNEPNDNQECTKLIVEDLLPVLQYFSYIQVEEYERGPLAMYYSGSYSAWSTYSSIAKEHQKLVCKKIKHKEDIWTVFSSLFSKEAL